MGVEHASDPTDGVSAHASSAPVSCSGAARRRGCQQRGEQQKQQRRPAARARATPTARHAAGDAPGVARHELHCGAAPVLVLARHGGDGDERVARVAPRRGQQVLRAHDYDEQRFERPRRRRRLGRARRRAAAHNARALRVQPATPARRGARGAPARGRAGGARASCTRPATSSHPARATRPARVTRRARQRCWALVARVA